MLGYRCIEILPEGVKLSDDTGAQLLVEADTVCCSVGMKANSETVISLKNALPGVPVFEIGDCNCVGKVANATESSYRAALAIA